MLDLEVYDQAANLRLQSGASELIFGEQARHALLVEAVGFVVDGALCGSGLSGSLGWRVTEEHDRPQEFVLTLLGPPRKRLDLLPIFGVLYLLAPAHLYPLQLPPERRPASSRWLP